MRRAWLLALALLLPGCVGAIEAPGTPPEVIPTPPARERLLVVFEGDAREYRTAGECVVYRLRTEPHAAQVGEWVTVTLRIQNCGTRVLERLTPSLYPGWDPRFYLDGETYSLWNGTASASLLYPHAIGNWSLQAGETQEVSWRWNGTSEQRHPDGPRYVPVSTGVYTLQSVFSGTRSFGERSTLWAAETQVAIINS